MILSINCDCDVKINHCLTIHGFITDWYLVSIIIIIIRLQGKFLVLHKRVMFEPLTPPSYYMNRMMRLDSQLIDIKLEDLEPGLGR